MHFKDRFTYHTKTDLLGIGGFARVFRATDNLLKRTVALKFFTNIDETKYNLINEISRSIALEHPNICRYYDAAILQGTNIHGDAEQTEVGIMEYLDGGNIKEYLQRNPQHLDKLLNDTLQGLYYLHTNENDTIIHRDIKPGNVLIKNTRQGPVAKITDFGISKTLLANASRSTQTLGTPAYMAPEQFEPVTYGIDGDVTVNADIWSFGVLAYELITGKMLFEEIGGQTTGQAIIRVLTEDYARKIEALQNEKYKDLLKACLVRKAADRCSDCSELVLILEGKSRHDGSDKEVLFLNVFNQAKDLYRNENYEAALAKVKQALFIKPGSSEALSLHQQIEAALERTRVIPLEKPGGTHAGPEPDQFFDVAKRCFERKDYEGARLYVEKVLKIRPADKEALALLDNINFEQRAKRQRLKEYLIVGGVIASLIIIMYLAINSHRESSGFDYEQARADSARIADSIRISDSIAAAQAAMYPSDTNLYLDTMVR